MHKTQLPDDKIDIQLSPIYEIGEAKWLSAFPSQFEDIIVKDGEIFDQNLNQLEFTNFKSAHRIRPNYVQRFSNGDYLLVDARETTNHPNAYVCDQNGKYQASYNLGDGVSKVIVDKMDRIWVGYFDEGVFGSSELSRHGLNRFSKLGRLEYSFQCEGLWIDDCYNLNIDEDNNAIIAPYSTPKTAIIKGQAAQIILSDKIANVPHGLFINNEFIAKLGAGFDKNDPEGEWEKLAYLCYELSNGTITIGPMYDTLDEDRFKIYETCVTLIDRETEHVQLFQVYDDAGCALSLCNCNTYQNRALIVAEGKIYALRFEELLSHKQARLK